jgi:hypothetical protein
MITICTFTFTLNFTVIRAIFLFNPQLYLKYILYPKINEDVLLNLNTLLKNKNES